MEINKKQIITFLVIILVIFLCLTIYLLVNTQINRHVENFAIPSWITDRGYVGAKELNLDPTVNYSPNAYCRGVGNPGIKLNGIDLIIKL